MENILKLVRNTNKQKAITSAAVGLGVLLIIFAKKKRKTYFYSTELVETLLLQMKRDYFPICKQLQLCAKKIIANYRTRYKKVPPVILKNLQFTLLVENSLFKKQIVDFENRIYSDFGVEDRAAFQRKVKELATSSEQVANLVQEIKANIRKACRGEALVTEVDLPEHVSPKVVLEIYEACVCYTLSQLNEYMTKCSQNKEQPNTYDFEFSARLKGEIGIEKFKLDLLKKHGFDCSREHHELLVFETAMRRFREQFEDFRLKVEQIDQDNNRLLQEHLKPEANLESLKAQIKHSKTFELLASQGQNSGGSRTEEVVPQEASLQSQKE